MIRDPSSVMRLRSRSRGFTLIEATISMVLVSVVLVAALSTVGASQRNEYKISQQCQGLHLAQGLMIEILQQAYVDPAVSVDSLGPASSELSTGNRSLFNDVDDYAGWSANPPRSKDGTTLTGFEDWERRVEVHWVPADNMDTTSNTSTGVKRIDVTVSCKGIPVASLSAIRTNAWATP